MSTETEHRGTVYGLTAEWREIADGFAFLGALDGEEAEQTQAELFARIEALESETADKVERMAALVKYLEGAATETKAEADRLAARAKSHSTQAQAVKDRIAYLMGEARMKTIKGERFTVSRLEPRKSVDIFDDGLVPLVWMRQPPPEPDKTRIRKALDAGEIIPGACLRDGRPSVQIR